MTISTSKPVCDPYREEIKILRAALSEIAESMAKPFSDPAEHANWCIERATEALKT